MYRQLKAAMATAVLMPLNCIAIRYKHSQNVRHNIRIQTMLLTGTSASFNCYFLPSHGHQVGNVPLKCTCLCLSTLIEVLSWRVNPLSACQCMLALITIFMTLLGIFIADVSHHQTHKRQVQAVVYKNSCWMVVTCSTLVLQYTYNFWKAQYCV